MIVRMYERAEEGIIAFLLVAMTLLVFLDVVMRFGFGSGFLWSQELTLYGSAWFVLFGVSYGLKVGAHIGVDAAVKLLPLVMQRYVTALAVVLCLAYCGIFLYGAWVYLSKIYTIGVSMDDLRYPMWVVNNLPEEIIEAWQVDLEDPLLPLWMTQSIMLLGLVLLSIRLFELLWAVITGRSTGFQHVGEAEESLHLARELAMEQQREQQK